MVVAGFAQALLRAEVVKHEYLAEIGGLCDGPKAGVEAMAAELIDRRVNDARTCLRGGLRRGYTCMRVLVGLDSFGGPWTSESATQAQSLAIWIGPKNQS